MVEIRVLVADDSAVIRAGVTALLDLEPGIRVVATAGSLGELNEGVGAAFAEPGGYDIVITDIRMPPTHTDEGIAAAESLRATHPWVGVIVLSQFADPAYLSRLIHDGAARRGYLLKDSIAEPGELITAIELVNAGGSFVDRQVADLLVERRVQQSASPIATLTPRELDVLAALATGRSNVAIGAMLFIGNRAVEKHIPRSSPSSGCSTTRMPIGECAPCSPTSRPAASPVPFQGDRRFDLRRPSVLKRLELMGAMLLGAALVSAACTGPDVARDEPTAPSAAPQATMAEPPPTTPSTTPTPSTMEIPTQEGAIEAGPSRDFSAISPIVQDFVDDRGLNGAALVIVDQDDGIVHEEYWGEFSAERVSLIASSSKMIVAGVLMALDDQGLLDIDAPVADVVDWGAGNPQITPAQLLSNSSGLVGLFPNPVYSPYICQYLAQGTLVDCAASIFTTDRDDADVAAPDTEFRYGGAQWQVAGAVAEVVSGRSWAQLIDDIYVEPCGVESLAFNNHWAQFSPFGFTYPDAFDADPATLAPTENPNMEGGAYITATDYGELLLMHLRGGRCGERQVLTPAAIDRMHADRIGQTYDGSANGQGYGMGWWIDRNTGRLSDPGAYGTTPWLDLDDRYGVSLVVEADGATGAALAALITDPIEQTMTTR